METSLMHDLSDKMVSFLETGSVPDKLFHPDVELDLGVPTWRVQSRGAANVIRVRKDRHPWAGQVTRTRLDPTPAGFVMEFEERWEDQGQHWYCREMLRADVVNGQVSGLSVYCTGDWDEACQQEYAHGMEGDAG